MSPFKVIAKAAICGVVLFICADTFAQSLIGKWDLVESPDGRGPTAGTMTLSANGTVNFAGNRSTWQPNDSTVHFTVIGAMQVPATEVSLQLNGATLQGKLVAYKYRLSGGQAVQTSEQAFSLSARRPDGYVEPNTSSRQSTTPLARQNTPQEYTLPSRETGVESSRASTSSDTTVISRTATESRTASAETKSTNGTSGAKPPPLMQDQLEAVAICWQNSRDQSKYGCDGPIQNLIIADYTLEQGLDLVGCPNPRLTEGSRTVKNKSVTVYLCGYGLISSDRDVVKRNELVVQRNTYSCPKSKWRCKEQR